MNNIKIVDIVRDPEHPITYLLRDKITKADLWYQLPPNFMAVDNKEQIIDSMWTEAINHFMKIRGQK